MNVLTSIDDSDPIELNWIEHGTVHIRIRELWRIAFNVFENEQMLMFTTISSHRRTYFTCLLYEQLEVLTATNYYFSVPSTYLITSL